MSEKAVLFNSRAFAPIRGLKNEARAYERRFSNRGFDQSRAAGVKRAALKIPAASADVKRKDSVDIAGFSLTLPRIMSRTHVRDRFESHGATLVRADYLG